MSKTYIVANWKSNKTVAEAKNWFQAIQNLEFRIQNNVKKEIIICPPFTLLSEISLGVKNNELGIKVGAQDISPFDEGAYTGEINGKQIKEFADYVIIGHSERRKYFGETEEIVSQKIGQTKKHGLIPIVCVSNIDEVKSLSTFNFQLSTFNFLVAYEPLFAIGSGTPDTPENAEINAKEIKQLIHVPVLYGGSVTSQNVENFTKMPNIDGVLVGGASLDPQEFASIVAHHV